jgi:hypothetical protein
MPRARRRSLLQRACKCVEFRHLTAPRMRCLDALACCSKETPIVGILASCTSRPCSHVTANICQQLTILSESVLACKCHGVLDGMQHITYYSRQQVNSTSLVMVMIPGCTNGHSKYLSTADGLQLVPACRWCSRSTNHLAQSTQLQMRPNLVQAMISATFRIS